MPEVDKIEWLAALVTAGTLTAEQASEQRPAITPAGFRDLADRGNVRERYDRA